MHELNICDLQNLILDGRKAMQYAWDHYDELITRNVIYTLYGPYDYPEAAERLEKLKEA